MRGYKPILIACPQYQAFVRGDYEADEAGGYRLGDGGQFLLTRVRCRHRGGRCMQTLCVLHRHNRRGKRSWYPEKIVAMPDPPGRPKRRLRRGAGDPAQRDGATLSVDA